MILCRPQRAGACALLAVAALLAPPAGATEVPYEGTLSVQILPWLPPVVVAGGGVADVGVSPGGAITRVALAANDFETTAGGYLLTDPSAAPVAELALSVRNDAGELTRPGGSFAGVIPLRGIAKVCLFQPCPIAVANVTAPLSVIGAGGAAVATFYVNVTIEGAPWTSGTLMVDPPTRGGASITVSGSATGSRVRLVTPVMISTNIGAFAYSRSFASLLLEFLAPTGESACSNGLDGDGDGLVDHPADPGCDGPDDDSERSPALVCDDGVDNDGDGRIDAARDPGCDAPADPSERSSLLVCDDGVDQDGDGLADAPDDPGCAGPGDTSERGTAACDDGEDDDGDGLVDLEDPGCADAHDDSERGASAPCDDGVDEDGDGAADYPADPGCASIEDPSERSPALACDDGLDQDGDGRIDHPLDPGCASPSDPSERSALLACDDGLDNDGDGLADHPADPGCVSPADPFELESGRACDDALDNDGDGFVDGDDAGCTGVADPRESLDLLGPGVVHVVAPATSLPGESLSAGEGARILVIAGGVVDGTIEIGAGGEAFVDGGEVGDLRISGDGALRVTGGALGGALEAADEAVVEIRGHAFDLPLGEVAASSGQLIGTLLDGTLLDVAFTRAPGAVIRLVPEPGAAAAGAAALAALAGLRARRRRR